MAFQVYSFSQITSNVATAMQGACTALLDFTVGAPLLAISQATAGVVLWLQAIILQLLTLTRAATSNGVDLDSFVNDFGLYRLPAAFATGTVTFSRFTNTQQASIPISSGVQTSDGTQKFFVTIDTTNPAYNATLNAYLIPAGVSSLTVPVMAAVAGTGGNIQPGTLSTFTTGIPGVDTAGNTAGFINGINAESDPALRQRFVLYLASLSKATKTAVGYAITSVQQGLSYTITENTNYNGTADLGFFTVIVDDGSGSPSTTLLTNVTNAVDAVRPLGSRFGVYPPTVLTANVSMILATAAGYTHSAIVASVVTALQSFINALPLATSVPYTQLAAIAYGIQGVTNVSGITLNGGTTDLTATVQNKLLAGTITVS